jgi:4-hydroxybutyrate dehydrogenase
MVNVFNYPTTIIYGSGATAALAERIAAREKGSRLLLVTDKGVVGAGLAARVAGSMKQAGLFTEVFDAVHPNPLEEDVEAGAAAYRAGKFAGLLAVGGGSPMDVAKAIAVLATHPAPLELYDDTKNGAEKIVSPLPPIYAVPTTAGTGSEVGRSAVVTLRRTKRKTIIFHPTLLPRIAVLEPELTAGLPPRITAATGMDAFTHGLEAYFARGFHPIADSVAIGCVEMVIENLPRAVEHGDSLEARGKMLLAASMGATAFQKGLGVVHSLAHPLSTRYGMHHGTTNALLLPPALGYQIEVRGKELSNALRGRWQRAARLFPEGERARPEDLPGAIAAFNRRVGLSESLPALGLRREDIPALAHEAFEDPCHQENPLPMTEKDLALIYERCL